jgi:hypothetical protein
MLAHVTTQDFPLIWTAIVGSSVAASAAAVRYVIRRRRAPVER